MSFEMFIARRLRLSGRKGQAAADAGGRGTATGSIIAVAGIAVALVVMMLSIAVMLGFKHEIRAKVLGFDAQLTVYPPATAAADDIEGAITLTPRLESTIRSVVPDARLSLTVAHPAIFKTADNFMGVVLRGFADNDAAAFIASHIIDGKIPDFNLPADSVSQSVVISDVMANRLDLKAGDRIQACFFDNNAVRARNLTVEAVYNTNFSDYDELYAFTSNSLLQSLAGVGPDTGSAVYVNNVGDDEAIEKATADLLDTFYRNSYSGDGEPVYQLSNIHQTGALYFSWLELLDTNVVIILLLMAAVSGFTLISSLFIIILERVNMIGILKALGATNAQIRRIFIIVAQRLVVRGLLIGNVIGLLLIFVQDRFRVVPLDPEAYYLSYVPVEAGWLWIAGLNAAVIVISVIMLLVPTHIITTISPARAIRYD